MQSFIKCLFGIFLMQTMGASGQEVDPKMKILLPPGQEGTTPKIGSNNATNEKIEASKGNRTLPPGLNTTQMVAEQYRSSGGLKPYNPSNVNNAQGKPGNTGVSSLAGTQSSPNQGSQQKPSTIPAGNKNLKSSQMNMDGANTGSSKSQGGQSGQAPVYGSLQKTPSSGYEQPGSPLGGGTKPLNVKSGNITNQYESATSPLNGSNQGKLPPGGAANQKTMNSANSAGNVYDKVPGLINYNPAPSQPANPYGSLQLKPEAQNNTYGAPPNAQRGSNSYGTLPLAPAQGAGSNTYGPPPNAGGQNNTYGAPPRTGNQSSNTYGPPPNAGGQNNTYGAPPRTGNQSSNTVGTPQQTGTNAKQAPTQMQGPLPPVSPSGTQQQVQANNTGGYSTPPPPASGGQSSGSENKVKSPAENPKELKKTDKGGPIKVTPKTGGPGKQ